MFRALFGLFLLLASLLGSRVVAAAPEADPMPKKQELDELRRKIQELQHDLSRTEASHAQASDGLKESEQAISQTNRTLHELEQQRQEIETMLQDIQKQQNQLQQEIQQQQQRLAKQLGRYYQYGQQDGVKVLLNNENPHTAARQFYYFSYLSRAENDLIQKLRNNLQRTEILVEETRAKKSSLQSIQNQRLTEKQRLEQEQSKRKVVIAQLATKIYAQRQQISTLKRDEENLGELVARLTKMLAEKRERERKEREERERREKERLAIEKRERERKEREAREKAEAAAKAAKEAKKAQKKIHEEKRKAEKNDKSDKVDKSEKIDKNDKVDKNEKPDADKNTAEEKVTRPENEKVVARNQALPDEDLSGRFVRLRGKLRLPTRGDVTNRFGTMRPEGGISWKGLFIRAGSGQSVHAIAPGQVVFADWIRGFGNLLILDHGDGYMSLYGYNEALLKSVGQRVKSGEQIATVGNSGGAAEAGVYFELRHQGRPFDPLAWVR